MTHRRYPLVPFIAVFLKIAAVVALLLIGYFSVETFATTLPSWFKETQRMTQTPYGPMNMPIEQIKDIKGRLLSLVQPTLLLISAIGLWAFFWGLSDVMHAARETEYHTRLAAPVKEKPRPQPEPEDDKVEEPAGT